MFDKAVNSDTDFASEVERFMAAVGVSPPDRAAVQLKDMLAPATTTDANDEVAQFLRESGVLRELQQQALEVNLRQAAHSQGFEILHISNRHYPAVEFSVLMGDLQDHKHPVLLRSKVCRLLWTASVRVSVSNVFARCQRALVRVACVPEWD